jgi:nitrate reductase delta subunit
MSFSACYSALASLLSYPENRAELLHVAEEVRDRLLALGVENTLSDFIYYVENSSLGTVQEEYVRVFDLSPICYPHLSHHIFGESYKRGEYMVELKAYYRRHGFSPPEGELPDHIVVVLNFLSRLEKEERRNFLARHVLQGVSRMAKVIAREGSPYAHVLEACNNLCSTEVKEVKVHA